MSSDARRVLIGALRRAGYLVREFVLTPTQFGTPNSRPRYYAVARLKSGVETAVSTDLKDDYEADLHLNDNDSESQSAVLNCVDNPNAHTALPNAIRNALCDTTRPISAYLVNSTISQRYIVPRRIYRYVVGLDLVRADDRFSGCFTRGYTRMLKGGGSALIEGAPQRNDALHCRFDELVHRDSVNCQFAEVANGQLNGAANAHCTYEQAARAELTEVELEDILKRVSLKVPGCPNDAELDGLRLRWFAPREVANLLDFPADFSWPSNIVNDTLVAHDEDDESENESEIESENTASQRAKESRCSSTSTTRSQTVTDKQIYQLLGNSLNVKVVAILVRYLFSDTFFDGD